jgi:hypothetical protein
MSYTGYSCQIMLLKAILVAFFLDLFCVFCCINKKCCSARFEMQQSDKKTLSVYYAYSKELFSVQPAKNKGKINGMYNEFCPPTSQHKTASGVDAPLPKQSGSCWIPGSWILRMVYTDDIPCPEPRQESNGAGQYQAFD